MQSPAGFILRNGRAEMNDFGALLTNPYVFHQYPHVLLSGLVTAGVFVTAISAWHLLRKRQLAFFRTSLVMGMVCALLASLAIAASGHLQTQYISKVQPMKLAAVEALWDTTSGAPFSLVAHIDQDARRNTAALAVPGALSMLAKNSPDAVIAGMNQIEQDYIAKYGKGNYLPPVAPLFWSFRIMVIAGGWMILLLGVAVWLLRRGKLEDNPLLLKLLLYCLPVPYIANSAGWFVAEAGRQPWIVFGLQRVDQGVSIAVGAGSIWVSLIGFTLVYGILAVIAAGLMKKSALAGPVDAAHDLAAVPKKGATLWS